MSKPLMCSHGCHEFDEKKGEWRSHWTTIELTFTGTQQTEPASAEGTIEKARLIREQADFCTEGNELLGMDADGQPTVTPMVARAALEWAVKAMPSYLQREVLSKFGYQVDEETPGDLRLEALCEAAIREAEKEV